jgi:hypothetical protein
MKRNQFLQNSSRYLLVLAGCALLWPFCAAVAGSGQAQPANRYEVFRVGSVAGRGWFPTISAALGAAGAFRTAHPSAAIRIEIAPGDHYVGAPLKITPLLSGTSSAPTEIEAEPGRSGTVRVLAGRKLSDLRWKPYRHGIMQSHVAGPSFDQLYMNGVPQVRARYPNYNPKVSPFGGYAADALAPARVARWKDPAGAVVVALQDKRWGGEQIPILGKRADGSLEFGPAVGNNRPSPPHPIYRYVENVFEELDSPGEWFYNARSSTLYFYPPKGTDLGRAALEVSGATRLFDLEGSDKDPVRHVRITGLSLLHTGYSYLRATEPLLRSDWRIAREAAIYLEGTEDVVIEDNEFSELGGTAVFVSGYNRRSEIVGNHIHDVAGGGIYFIGRADAVRSPKFSYDAPVDFGKIDRTPGPRSDDYPADSAADDNLIHHIGTVEKSATAVDIDIAMGIHVGHNTIYDVPRAGINIGDGAFGGHIVEFNDVFDTVLETGDNGAFNSWGRDRYWSSDRDQMDRVNAADPGLWKLDVIKPIILRYNRFQCDHGWDIDLDDGSSNYRIYDNVLLAGGLKFREGFDREATNNILINNAFHQHVWFANSGDKFEHNIVMASYQPILMTHWNAQIDYNLFTSKVALGLARKLGLDAHSRAGDPKFIDPARGDYRVAAGSPALALGFNNFSMSDFGVTSRRLRALARAPAFPELVQATAHQDKTYTVLGAKVKSVTSLGEQSAAGLGDASGVLVLAVPPDSLAAKSGLEANDVIVELSPDAYGTSQQPIDNVADLLGLVTARSWRGEIDVVVVRDQRRIHLTIKTAQN